METDGIAGYIDLKTSYDYLNGLRAGKFGIVTVFNVDSDCADYARLLSNETSPNNAYRMIRNTTADSYSSLFGGTSALDGSFTSTENKIHNIATIINISTTNGWVSQDGVLVVTDPNVSGLNAGQNTLLRLGRTSYVASTYSKAKFGFTAILDFTDVTTVDATWSTELSEAINAAAIASNYDATAIANAIYNYDNAIKGVYYPLNEASSGDTSSYYLLARDIQDDSVYTSEFYGLVSPSGVIEATVVTGGGRYSSGYRTNYRSRYNGGYR